MTSYMNVSLHKFWLGFSDPKINVIHGLSFIPDSKVNINGHGLGAYKNSQATFQA